MSQSGGPRRRVGLLVPSSNTVMEVDFYRSLPEHVTVHTGRMHLKETTPEAEAIMLDEHTLPAAHDLATTQPELLVFGCTSAGALRGNEGDAAICEAIAEATGVETMSVIASVRQRIAGQGLKTVVIGTPYIDALNERIHRSLGQDGLEVLAIRGMGITDNFRIGQVTPEEIVEFALETMCGYEPEVLFLSCTNLRALEALPVLRQRLELPVVSSNSCVLEVVRSRLGLGASWTDRPPETSAKRSWT